MLPPFDIFRIAPDGHLIWRATAENLDSAHRRIRILRAIEPGDYVIFSQETGNKTVIRAQDSLPGEPSSPH